MENCSPQRQSNVPSDVALGPQAHSETLKSPLSKTEMNQYGFYMMETFDACLQYVYGSKFYRPDLEKQCGEKRG